MYHYRAPRSSFSGPARMRSRVRWRRRRLCGLQPADSHLKETSSLCQHSAGKSDACAGAVTANDPCRLCQVHSWNMPSSPCSYIREQAVHEAGSPQCITVETSQRSAAHCSMWGWCTVYAEISLTSLEVIPRLSADNKCATIFQNKAGGGKMQI